MGENTNNPPVIVASAGPLTGESPLTVTFSSEGSYDPEGDGLSCLWQFGDGWDSHFQNTAHTYTWTGTYTASLTVSDSEGASSKKEFTIIVK